MRSRVKATSLGSFLGWLVRTQWTEKRERTSIHYREREGVGRRKIKGGMGPTKHVTMMPGKISGATLLISL